MATKLETRNAKIGRSDLGPVSDFTDLQAWKLARELSKHVYDLTSRLPAHEKCVLIAQIRRVVTESLNRKRFVCATENSFESYLSELRKASWTDDIWKNARRKIWWLTKTS